MVKCDVVRDWKTGDSLCYGFVEFARAEDAEAASADAAAGSVDGAR